MDKALCLLAGVFALISMANAQGLCSSIDDIDCGSGFVTTGRDSFVCANDPCDVDTPGADDHPDCCMAEIVPLDCSDIEQGKPLQVIGYRDPDLQFTNVSKLNILTGQYDLLFDLEASRTTPNHEKLNACAVNPLDQNLYCLVKFADDSTFMVRFDATSVHYIAELNMSMGFPVSGIIDEEGDFFVYQFETGNYYMIPAVQNMAGKADQADTPFFDHADMFFTSTNNVELRIFDIVIVNGNFDNKGEARWLFGLTSTKNENLVSSIYFNKGVATKATAGVDFGETFILNHSFTDESIAPTSGGWGAGWMYYDNILFASNRGSGLFLCEIDIPKGLVYMSRVGLSDATNMNDGMNCGPPALLPFASCRGRTGPGTTATVDADCGAGWVADLSSDLVCDFDPNLGLGCNTGTSSSPDQRKCCNLNCSTYSCNGHGTPFADNFDTGCFCDCDLGYTGDQCDECAPAYTGYPNCIPTLAPSLSPFSSSPTTSDPTLSPSMSSSSSPTSSPTTSDPTLSPTVSPTTSNPTSSPTSSPTTSDPILSPTVSPTTSDPTRSPTSSPTTSDPTLSPTVSPTTSDPTQSPSCSQMDIQSTADCEIFKSFGGCESDISSVSDCLFTCFGCTLPPTLGELTVSPTSSPTSAWPTVSPLTSSPTLIPTLEPTLAPTCDIEDIETLQVCSFVLSQGFCTNPATTNAASQCLRTCFGCTLSPVPSPTSSPTMVNDERFCSDFGLQGFGLRLTTLINVPVSAATGTAKSKKSSTVKVTVPKFNFNDLIPDCPSIDESGNRGIKKTPCGFYKYSKSGKMVFGCDHWNLTAACSGDAGIPGSAAMAAVCSRLCSEVPACRGWMLDYSLDEYSGLCTLHRQAGAELNKRCFATSSTDSVAGQFDCVAVSTAKSSKSSKKTIKTSYLSDDDDTCVRLSPGNSSPKANSGKSQKRAKGDYIEQVTPVDDDKTKGKVKLVYYISGAIVAFIVGAVIVAVVVSKRTSKSVELEISLSDKDTADCGTEFEFDDGYLGMNASSTKKN